MGSKLYVGGLPYSVTEGRLQELFSAHGTVESASVISDKFTGQSRGFGFVEMSSSNEAQSAIQSLNGTQFEGRSLTVNEAKPMAKRDNFGGGGGRGGRVVRRKPGLPPQGNAVHPGLDLRLSGPSEGARRDSRRPGRGRGGPRL